MAGLAFALFLLASPRTASLPSYPVPNGYDQFVKATEVLQADSRDLRELSEQELKEVIAQNAEALRLVRSGLLQECRVRIDSWTNDFTADLPLLTGFRDIAKIVAAEGRLAELEQRTNDAVRIYLELVLFGEKCANGGLILDKLVGLVCERLGMEPLRRLLPNMSTVECRRTIQVLEKMDSDSESAEKILKREKLWIRQTMPGISRFVVSIASRILDLDGKSRQRLVAKVSQAESDRHRLLVDLAVRAYELEQGKSPRTFADLVPAYLKTTSHALEADIRILERLPSAAESQGRDAGKP